MIRKGIALIVMLLFIGMIISPSSSKIISFDDTIPPFTTIYFDPPKPNGNNGWYTYCVITLKAKDNESGVNVTYYRLNDGEWNIYTNQFKIQGEGIIIIEFYSVDNAGNEEDVKSAELKLDKKAPLLFTEWDVIKKDIVRCTAFCYEYISGTDRVEFYNDYELVHTDYKKPYEWIWDNAKSSLTDVIAYDKAGNWCPHPAMNITPTRVRGFIWSPEYIEYKVTFYALKVYLPNNCEVVKFEQMTFVHHSHYGHIGRFFIWAAFRY